VSATSTSSTTFADYAAAYRAAGLLGTLPLPVGRKFPPPSGYTGEDGALPTAEDIAAWSDRFGADFNLALRLPEDIVGIDVDAYDDKPGAVTLADAEAKWGQLPPTYISSAREDGVSGIRLYRIPTGLDWPNEVGPSIETVRFGHRYVPVSLARCTISRASTRTLSLARPPVIPMSRFGRCGVPSRRRPGPRSWTGRSAPSSSPSGPRRCGSSRPSSPPSGMSGRSCGICSTSPGAVA
jgi:hypothetical protein